jgi:hypothetical protein
LLYPIHLPQSALEYIKHILQWTVPFPVDAMLDELDSIAQQTSKSSAPSAVHQPVYHQAQYHYAQPANGMQGRTASSATKELDDLMASLSDFKVNVGGATSNEVPTRGSGDYSKPQKSKNPGTVFKVNAKQNLIR